MGSKAVPFKFISAALFLVSMGLVDAAVAPPLFEFLMNSQNGSIIPNTGTASDVIPTGVITPIHWGTPNKVPSDQINPVLVSNVPPNGGVSSLDLTNLVSPDTTEKETGGLDVATAYYQSIPQLADLKSFTICGWINRTGPASSNNGGDRVVSWIKPDPSIPLNQNGVDLAYQGDGSLKLGVNQYADKGVCSKPGFINPDASGSPSNWVYFAVTYDATTTEGITKFYFGTPNSLAQLDRDTASVAHYSGRGITKNNFGSGLTIGNEVPTLRSKLGMGQRFKGMLDQIRIYGSKTDASGALVLADIQSVQNIPQPTGQAGVKCEIWDNVSGPPLDQYSFPLTQPSSTLYLPNLMTPTNRPQSNQYVMRLTGWIKAPESGNYSFQIGADDEGMFFLSTDANPVNAKMVVRTSSWSPPKQYTGLSQLVPLIKGNYYFFEGRMKENGGDDNFEVAWTTPSGSTQSGISAGNLFLTPPDFDPLFPSSIPLYEKGTTTEKATIGWLKEPGNDHFFIRTDGAEAISIKRDTVKVARNLAIGPQGDFRFHWENPNNFFSGRLSLMRGGDVSPAFVVGSATSAGAQVEFPNTTLFTGDHYPHDPDPVKDAYTNGRALSSLASFDGLIQTRNWNKSAYYDFAWTETSIENANHLYFTQTALNNYQEKSVDNSSELNSNKLTINSNGTTGPGKTSVELNSSSLTFISQATTPSTVSSFGASAISLPGGTVNCYSVNASEFVSTKAWRIPDFVFEKDYKLKSLDEVEKYINKEKHLPDVPSAKQIGDKGLDLAEMNVKLLQTVEELTLHLIEIKKEVNQQKTENKKLVSRMNKLQKKVGEK